MTKKAAIFVGSFLRKARYDIIFNVLLFIVAYLVATNNVFGLAASLPYGIDALVYFVIVLVFLPVCMFVGHLIWQWVEKIKFGRQQKRAGEIFELFPNHMSKTANLKVFNTTGETIECYALLKGLEVYWDNGWADIRDSINPSNFRMMWKRNPENEEVSILPDDYEVLEIAKLRSYKVLFKFCGSSEEFSSNPFWLRIELRLSDGSKYAEFTGYLTPTRLMKFPDSMLDALELSYEPVLDGLTPHQADGAPPRG
jgi:hypothetical protein